MHFDLNMPGDFAIDLNFEKTSPKKLAGETVGLGTRRVVTKPKRRKFYDLSKVPNAIALLRELPKKGETLHAIMGGDFHAWDLIPAMQRMMGRPIEELIITTLGFNLANNQNLCDMLDAGTVKSAHLLCSSYFEGADKDVFNTAQERLTVRGQRIKAIRNHSKVILIAPEGTPDRYCFESSANLRSCNNLEQFALSNCPELYAFHRSWIFHALEQ